MSDLRLRFRTFYFRRRTFDFWFRTSDFRVWTPISDLGISISDSALPIHRFRCFPNCYGFAFVCSALVRCDLISDMIGRDLVWLDTLGYGIQIDMQWKAISSAAFDWFVSAKCWCFRPSNARESVVRFPDFVSRRSQRYPEQKSVSPSKHFEVLRICVTSNHFHQKKFEGTSQCKIPCHFALWEDLSLMDIIGNDTILRKFNIFLWKKRFLLWIPRRAGGIFSDKRTTDSPRSGSKASAMVAKTNESTSNKSTRHKKQP